jgi:hypothetical protein
MKILEEFGNDFRRSKVGRMMKFGNSRFAT